MYASQDSWCATDHWSQTPTTALAIDFKREMILLITSSLMQRLGQVHTPRTTCTHTIHTNTQTHTTPDTIIHTLHYCNTYQTLAPRTTCTHTINTYQHANTHHTRHYIHTLHYTYQTLHYTTLHYTTLHYTHYTTHTIYTLTQLLLQ